jgi:hypothetical protein
VIRAKVRRDGPGEWSWTLTDDQGDLIVGIVPTWEEAITDVGRELIACGWLDVGDDRERMRAVADRGPVTGGYDRVTPPAPLVSPDVVGRSWLTRLLLGGPR